MKLYQISSDHLLMINQVPIEDDPESSFCLHIRKQLLTQ
jgi:hypothetical protein